jgi:cytochrome P450
MFALAQRPDIQAALRDECLSSPLPTGAKGNAPLDTEALAERDRLPLLDAVLRETLRLHAPVAVVMRAAAHADELPLANPFTDRRGVQRSSVPVRKGEMVAVPIRLVNHDTAIWGADAGEWRCVLRPLCGGSSLIILSHRPERWMDGSVGEKAKAIPGLWGSTLAFSGGSHSCIGYKFTIYECVPPASSSPLCC